MSQYGGVAQLRCALAEHRGLPASCLKLLPEGGRGELTDEQSIAECKLAPGSTVIVLENLRAGHSVFVVMPDGKKLTEHVMADDKVRTLKERLYDQTGIPADKQKLIFQGQSLDDAHSIADSGLSRESTVHMA
eukprot:CAMPEP_0177167326 /NCGR_PEP_ID=MMETSP0367-20130122/8493_1 /TAXON_ID=447022 ORGANISM="Scrippsiella hangoei-like, Strain SHHI-4" /NCGR_SAMPLE_ID=MMETSP0367 /ASSEMBLY_ACC=CAM_ASM_000362 /LENGTH=132 /DNA_ID=CAMNT_0018613425 /DNA_START=11 /DNA_END=409 /DNA_ORIENTATION=+